MNPLIPAAEFSLQRGTNLTNDVEMLQTDVMRFFAILALCLMAIFALVKALPMAPAADRPVIAPPDDIRAEAQSLQNQIALLKEKLTQTQTQVQAAAAAARQSSSRASQAAMDEQAVRERLIKTQQELQNTHQSLSKTRVDIQNREAKLDKLLGDIDRKQIRHSELKSQIEDETLKLKALQAELNKTREKMKQRLPQNQPPAKKISDAPPAKKIPDTPPAKKIPDAPPAPLPKRKGFTLRFASDAALQELIARGEVNFYALTGKKAWQLYLNAGQPAFSPVQSPRKIFEMEPSTVPPDYAEVFSHKVAAFGRDSITWGVTLPPQISASITGLIAGRDGGDLLIMPDGEVILN
jgi:hypothetical protein